MKTKYIVQLENNIRAWMILMKDCGNSHKAIPYAFKIMDSSHEIAYFNTKDEAIKAYHEACKYYDYPGIPVILEAIKD
ncbi:MAG: hypothetical protein LUH22_13045 [Bacteroides sp.]|nr:hypothetical protein [Bacteroides sp.]